MEFLHALGNWPGAVLLRESSTLYVFVNAAHILGIGLLLGAILPLDLRLLGFFRAFPLQTLAPFLLKCAWTSFAIALPAGLWLFSVKPVEYAENPAFLCKVALLALAFANIAFQHSGSHFRAALQSGGSAGRLRASALISLCLWISILVAGRWIGFL